MLHFKKMKSSVLSVLFFILTSTVTLIFFNNCSDGNFKSNSMNTDGGNQAAGTDQSQSSVFCMDQGVQYRVGAKVVGFAKGSSLYPQVCGAQITRTCLSSGQFDGAMPLFSSCAQQCVHPENAQAVASGTLYYSFTQAQGQTQALCDSYRVTSTCNATTGTFLPAPAATKTCLVQGQVCAYTTGTGLANPTGNMAGSTVSGYALSSATYPMLCAASVNRTCQANGQWSGSTPLYTSCKQRCVNPTNQQPVDQGASLVSYSIQSGTQAQCTAARVSSTCQASTGQFSPTAGTYANCQVVAGPTLSNFAASPATIQAGASSSLSWTQTGATTLTLNPGNINVTGRTSYSVTPATTTQYTLTATNAASSVNASVLVTVNAVVPNPPTSNITSARIAEVGHSLVNTVMPMSLMDIARGLNKQIDMRVQIINGSAMNYQWNNHTDAENNPPYFTDVYNALGQASNNFDVFIITERVPLQDTIDYEGSYEYARRWRDRAVQHNANIRLFMYTTWTGYGYPDFWPGVNTRADWRVRTEADGRIFEKMVTDVNAQIASGPRYKIVPGHRAMMALYDAIQTGEINWASGGINYFFQDDIHLNAIGNYYIACLHYSVVYKASPVGSPVPQGLRGSLSDAQARKLQEMAWTVASGYANSGITQ